MIAHPTGGSDGLEEGIHLRWQFDPLLGFPPAGFYLYRRKSCSKTICFDFDILNRTKIELPYKHLISKGGKDYEITLSPQKERRKVIELRRSLREVRGRPKISLPISTAIDLQLPIHTQQVRFDAIFEGEGSLEIISKINGLEIIRQFISGHGNESVSLYTPGITSLALQGKNATISKICFTICEDCPNPWQEPINGKCGYGLPIKSLQQKPEEEDHATVSTKKLTMTGDQEWDLAACRIPQDKWSSYQGQPFEDLRDMIILMVEGAKDAPMGWKTVRYENENLVTAITIPEAAEEPSPQMEISPLDLILLTAVIDPYIARILGLYWVDALAKAGEVYDYKVVANWPKGTFWNLRNCIDFEKEKIGRRFFNIFRHESCVIFSTGNCIVDAVPSAFAQATRGLHFSLWDAPNPFIRIHFTETTKEVQVFIRHQEAPVSLKAYRNHVLVDASSLAKPEGILAVHSQNNIDYVTLQAKDFILYKICSDSEFVRHGEYSYALCGIKKSAPQPMAVPTGLKAFALRGMTKTQADGSVLDHRFTTGLRWDLLATADSVLAPGAPILYHVQRKTPWGDVEWPTENSPIKVIPESYENAKLPKMWPQGWHQERMYYIDAVQAEGNYGYRIAAVDIFGRVSQYTDWAAVELRKTLPPPPADVEAKFLDPSDTSLSEDERAWITNSGWASALKVRWKWIDSLRRQAPDVNRFNVYLQPGWLNVVQGEIDENPAENSVTGMLELSTNHVNGTTPAVPDIVFAGEKLLLNQTSYTIESSKRDPATGRFVLIIKKPIPMPGDFATFDFRTVKITGVSEVAGPGVGNLELRTDWKMPASSSAESFVSKELTVNQKVYVVSACRKDPSDNAIYTVAKVYPQKGDFFSIPISRQDEPPAGLFLDYMKAANWSQLLHTEFVVQQTREQYQAILPGPPGLSPSRVNKVLYAQIGISSLNSEGEGSVSSAASVVAVFREPPPPQSIADSPNDYATVPNYYGKSSYAIRWPKSASNDVRYFVYRAMDEALFTIDAQIRKLTDNSANPLRSRSPNDYVSFLNSFDSVYHAEIKNKVISPATIDYKALVNDPLKNILLTALANLPRNEQAFTKLREEAIHPADPKFTNKNTEAQLPGQPETPPDTNLLLYVDDTLDGRANNRYFYRIRTINEIGSLGPFGLSTRPIVLPLTKPVPPKLKLENGDKKITIRLTPTKGGNVKGYLLYRTDDELKSKDIRKMGPPIKENPSDEFTITASTPLPEYYEYIDEGVRGRQIYFYCAVAVDMNDNRSNLSDIIDGQAIDSKVPGVVIDLLDLTWDQNVNRLIISWPSSDAELICEARRQPSWPGINVKALSYDNTNNRYYLEDQINKLEIYRYQVTVKTETGQEASKKIRGKYTPL